VRIFRLHSWKVDVREAPELQLRLAGKVISDRPLAAWRTVAAADVSYNRFSNRICAAVVVWEPETDSVVETACAVRITSFPYRTGLLSFREAPALIAAFARLKTRPDVVMFDGHGIAHPRRFGLACHVGLWLGRPAFGVAKSLLAGRIEGELGSRSGDLAHLRIGKDLVGAALRTKARCSPVFVSPGHLIDLATSIAVVRDSLRGRRLPEPARLAHEEANRLRRCKGAVNGTD
jgi:deoxyribonuclease V